MDEVWRTSPLSERECSKRGPVSSSSISQPPLSRGVGGQGTTPYRVMIQSLRDGGLETKNQKSLPSLR
jgi:hypothetical protein